MGCFRRTWWRQIVGNEVAGRSTQELLLFKVKKAIRCMVIKSFTFLVKVIPKKNTCESALIVWSVHEWKGEQQKWNQKPQVNNSDG